jgi:hypothetical protein
MRSLAGELASCSVRPRHPFYTRNVTMRGKPLSELSNIGKTPFKKI